MNMNLYNRLSRYHAESRPTFVLFTGLIGFAGTIATIVGMAVLFSLFQ